MKNEKEHDVCNDSIANKEYIAWHAMIKKQRSLALRDKELHQGGTNMLIPP